MTNPLAVLDRTEKEIAALLVAGLATRRSGRERMEELAGEVSALKMERLAAELRKLAEEQDPKSMANEALTALAMAGKIRERLAPWPRVEAGHGVALAFDPTVRVAMPEEPPESPDVGTLIRWMETGDVLLRAHAATLLVGLGDESVPELGRLARKATVAVRREAIAALGKVGGEAALRTLVGLLGDEDCWRALLQAILPYGPTVVPPLREAVSAEGAKKGQEKRRRMAAALLYRLGAYSELAKLGLDDDAIVRGFAIAGRLRTDAAPEKLRSVLQELQEGGPFYTLGIVTLAQAEVASTIDPAVQLLDQGAMNEVRVMARWAGCGSAIEEQLSEHYLMPLARGTWKNHQRAASILRGLAFPAVVIPLAGIVSAIEFHPGHIAEILGEIGGTQAVAILLDIARETRSFEATKALMQLGDPGAAPALLEILVSTPKADWAGLALVALGDSVVDLLAREMRAKEGTPLAAMIQQMLLQINTHRAKEALKAIDPDSLEALLERLGHPKLGALAAKSLAKRGEAILDRLEAVLGGSDPTASLNALQAIGAIKGEQAYSVVYQVATEALAKSKGFRSHDNGVIPVLARYADPRSTPLLVQALTAGSHFIQEDAFKALVKVGTAAVPQLLPLLDDPRPDARAKALAVLGTLRCAEAEHKAIALLGDASPQVRIAAAKALGQIGAATGNPKAAEALGIALEKEQVYRVGEMINSLAQIGDRRALPHLRRLVQIGTTGGLPQHLLAEAEEAIRKIEAANPEPESKGLMGKLRHILGGA